MPMILPITLSTITAQLAAGVAFMLVWRALRLGMPVLPAHLKTSKEPSSPKSKKAAKRALHAQALAPIEIAPHDPMAKIWLTVAGAAILAFILTMMQPAPPHMPGLTPPDPLWIRLPSLLLVVCAALAFLTWQNKGQVAFGLATTLSGWAALIAQSLMFTPTSLDSLSGLLPLALFILGALAIGAVHMQFLEFRARDNGVLPPAEVQDQAAALPTHKAAGPNVAVSMLRSVLWPLLLILALVPSVGAAGDPIMRQVALMWMESLPYWAGVMATAVALGISYLGQATSPIQWALVALGLFCTRLAFFSDGIHFSAVVLF